MKALNKVAAANTPWLTACGEARVATLPSLFNRKLAVATDPVGVPRIDAHTAGIISR